MEMEYCNRCKRYLAVVFLRKEQGGQIDGEGLCLTCARKAGLTQVDEMMKKMGISDEDIEQIQRDMLKAIPEIQ